MHNPCQQEIRVSIGIFAWNEEKAIAGTLDSLFQQSLFQNLMARRQRCEVICVLNGCTDRTAKVAKAVFTRKTREHPAAECFTARVADLPEKGKMNAWNEFVHQLSAREARVLIMLDADILIHRPNTLWNMLLLLEQDERAHVAVDLPCKDLTRRKHRSLRSFISQANSRMTRGAEAQLCGQLYAIRASTARAIYIPKDLSACEDGYLKIMVCTDQLAHGIWPDRIQIAPDAEHTFEAYTSVGAVLKNQKRQIIGQTVVHILVDKYFRGWGDRDRAEMAARLREQDRTERDWLKGLIRQHLGTTRMFWRLYPGLMSLPLKRLSQVHGLAKLSCIPAALASSALAFSASFLAWRALKNGSIHYWPKAERRGLPSTGSRVHPNIQLRAH